ncbi:MAG: hemerythrin domain-containing protein [Streptosporangiales bacterium]|nr:hemerythrin domain-containing protein [Streptosporangiales bacterium]
MAQHDRSVIQLLIDDHREVEQIFAQLESISASSHDERRRLTDQAIIELVRHSVAEEEYLYPAARQYIPNGEEIVESELSDHRRAERVMKKLEHTDPGEPRFGDLLDRLLRDVRKHVHDEENELFPRLTRHTDEKALVELGRRVAEAKASAPTRPHPSAPTERPGLLKKLAPGVGLVDQVRDVISGRGT